MGSIVYANVAAMRLLRKICAWPKLIHLIKIIILIYKEGEYYGGWNGTTILF